MWQELKTYLFTCDKCSSTSIVKDVPAYCLPEGWGIEHPNNTFGMFNSSKDVCAECLKVRIIMDDVLE